MRDVVYTLMKFETFLFKMKGKHIFKLSANKVQNPVKMESKIYHSRMNAVL